MKHTLQLLILFLLLATTATAQKITYSYDNAGNRIVRRVVILQNKAAFVASNNKMAGGGIDSKMLFTEQLGSRKITIYPNPTRGRLAVEIEGIPNKSNIKAQLFNIKGALLKQLPITANSKTPVDMQRLNAGTYLLVLFIDDERLTYKVIKQ